MSDESSAVGGNTDSKTTTTPSKSEDAANPSEESNPAAESTDVPSDSHVEPMEEAAVTVTEPEVEPEVVPIGDPFNVSVSMRDLFFDDPFFKNSWHDFDKVRDAMFAESRDLWKTLEERFQGSSRCINLNAVSSTLSEVENVENADKVEGGPPELEKQEKNDDSGKEAERVKDEAACSDDVTIVRTPREDQPAAIQDIKGRWENGWMFPRHWMTSSIASLENLDLFKTEDPEVVRVRDYVSGMEVSLDTALYKPEELKVDVIGNVVCIEGKHVEVAEDGSNTEVRSFSRTYSLPNGARAETVVANLSSDGILVVSMCNVSAVDKDVEETKEHLQKSRCTIY